MIATSALGGETWEESHLSWKRLGVIWAGNCGVLGIQCEIKEKEQELWRWPALFLGRILGSERVWLEENEWGPLKCGVQVMDQIIPGQN